MGSSVVAALDIGTYSIHALIAKQNESGLTISGYGKSPSVGIKKGMVSDIETCALSIKSAVDTAEKIAGLNIESAYVGFSGGDVFSSNVTSAVAKNESKSGITEADHEGILESCRLKVGNPEHFLIHLIPREYAVDGCWGIDNPVGMAGAKVEIEAHLIVGRTAAIKNLFKSLERAGITVKGLFFSPYVLADQLLQKAEKEIGYLLIDIGGGNAGLCWYHRGKPWLTTTLPVGGEHITSDLAIGLRIPISYAAKIKSQYGLNPFTAEREIVIDDLPNGPKTVSRQLVYEIIEARVNELIDFIEKIIGNYGQGIVPAGIILTGGGAQLPGLAEKISQSLELPVRVFKNTNRGKGNIIPEETTILKIMEYGVNSMTKMQDSRVDLFDWMKGRLKDVIYKFK